MRATRTQIACTIRRAKDEGEVRNLWESLTTEQHWNRSPHDAMTHIHSSTLDGWLVAVPKSTPEGERYPEDGHPQGCVIVYKFSNGTGWLSFFVTTETYRGYGLGRELFEAGMNYFHEHGSEYIGLDSVPEQRETYERRGFVDTNLIAICERSDSRDLGPADVAPIDGENIVELKSLDFDKLVSSDLMHSGLERTRLWTAEALLNRQDASGFAVVGLENALMGWILIRACENGYRFGPLYAKCASQAKRLLRTAMESLVYKDVSLVAETWYSNKLAVPTFEALGWRWTSNFHRMWYKKKMPGAVSPGGEAETSTYAIFDAAQG